jgi:hypothetical protein
MNHVLPSTMKQNQQQRAHQSESILKETHFFYIYIYEEKKKVRQKVILVINPICHHLCLRRTEEEYVSSYIYIYMRTYVYIPCN